MSAYQDTITLTKQSGTVLTLPLTGVYADRDAEFTLNVQAGSVTQGTPTIDTSTGVVTATSTVTAGFVSAGTPSQTLNLGLAATTITGNNNVDTTVTMTGSNVTLSDSDNGISVTSVGSSTGSAYPVATVSTAGYAALNGEIGSATLTGSDSDTLVKYISGVTITAPQSGTNSFSITVPDGNSTVTFVFNVDSSGNVTVTEG